MQINAVIKKPKNPEEQEIEKQSLPPQKPKRRPESPVQGAREDRALNAVIHVLLVIIAVMAFYPLYIVAISSVSDPSYISSGQVFLLPRGLNVDAYEILLGAREIWIGYRNSLFNTVVGTALQMVVTTAAGFALSRKTLPGRRFFVLFFLFTMYFSGGVIPTYFVLKDMGLLNTVWVLIIPVLVGPYNLVISRSYFENSIPEELYEAAIVDGAGIFRYYHQFAIPLAVPVLAVMVLNFALGHWNSYFNAMIYLSNDNIQTLQVFIKRITSQATATLDSGEGSAEQMIESIRKTQLLKYEVVVVSSVPMIALYRFVQRYFILGIMIGAVKG